MKTENMYRVLVATIFVLLMTVGIYIGVELTDKDDVQDKNNEVIVSSTDSVHIYDEQAEIIQDEEIIDVDVKFMDVYPDCGHSMESVEHQGSTTKTKVKEEIENKDLGYRLIGEQEGILLYQKVHSGICMNHYKVVLENGTVNIYRIGKTGEFEPYQVTEITSEMLREGIKEQLQAGIEVDDIEELILLMEDIES